MKKVLVIAGPTASGKTSFSIELAKRLNTEIISGDSIQVYKGFDIGSGKVTEAEKEGVPHHLIDILEPGTQYSVKDFQKEARTLIDNSSKPMIIAGGTGLYLKACLYDYVFTDEEASPRNEKYDQYTNHELYEMLVERDPVQAEKIHENNRQRVLRSLTVLDNTGKRQSEIIDEQNHEPIYDFFIAGCTMAREELYERINLRVKMMIEKGLEQEVKGLLDKGITFEDPAMKGIGYREWADYFNGNLSITEVEALIARNSRRYAKRQYTWLNHQMPVHWFDPRNKEERSAMLDEMVKFASN